MLTRVDHVMICVPDLERGIEAYQRIGFNIYPGGAHTGRPTHNAIAFTGEEYIEVLSIRDRAAVAPGGPDESLARYLDGGGGFRVVALQSDDLEGDVAAMRRRGVDVGEIRDGGRRTPAGQELRWRAAFPGPGAPLPVFFIQHLTPARGAPAPGAEGGRPSERRAARGSGVRDGARRGRRLPASTPVCSACPSRGSSAAR